MTTMPAPATTTAAAEPPRAVPPNGGEQLRFLGASQMRLKHDGGPDGELAFYEYVSEPGVTGAPQHVHRGHDETFYVVDGVYEFTMGDDRLVLDPGGFLFVPRGTPHTFRNAGDDVGRIIGTFTPSRFASYFRELAALVDASGGVPDHDSWVELYGRYDTAFADDAAPSATAAG